jgi:nucleotide-binding universal stress UspA family protein
MFKHILIPVDFTEKNWRALDIAVKLMKGSATKLSLLHVIEKIEFLAEEDTQEFYRTLEKTAEEKMAPFVRKLKDRDVPVSTMILYGKRPQAIVRYAAENSVDLLVLSSHRVEPDNPQDWGTISYKVAILSQCPVLLVK